MLAGLVASWWQRVYTELPAGGSHKASGANEWLELRGSLLTLFDEQARLERMARIIGKDALPARQQLTLFCAEWGRGDQSATPAMAGEHPACCHSASSGSPCLCRRR